MAATTDISIEKVSLLLQALLDVEKKSQKELPRDVGKLVYGLLEAQRTFVAGIDTFMHRSDEDDFEWESDNEATISAIIGICPEFLHTKDDGGFIPIYCSVGYNHQTNIMYLPLLAEAGMKHGVGGGNGRGGLLVEDNDGFNALQRCAYHDSSSHEVMKALMEMDPPLFVKEDILRYNLLNFAIEWSSSRSGVLKALEFYITMESSCIFQRDKNNEYPISNAFDVDVAQYLLRTMLKHNRQDPSIGGLFTTSSDGKRRTGLQKLIARFGQRRTWDMIAREVSLYKDLPILHRVIECVPDEINQVLSRFPHSLFVRDENNRLPIHVALENGLEWSAEFVAIMNSNILCLNEKDPLSECYPFVLAAKNLQCDLRTIHYLLRMHPKQIEEYLC